MLLKEKSVANFNFGLVMQGDNEEITTFLTQLSNSSSGTVVGAGQGTGQCSSDTVSTTLPSNKSLKSPRPKSLSNPVSSKEVQTYIYYMCSRTDMNIIQHLSIIDLLNKEYKDVSTQISEDMCDNTLCDSHLDFSSVPREQDSGHKFSPFSPPLLYTSSSEVVEEVRKGEVVRSYSSSSVVNGHGGESKDSTPSHGGAKKKMQRKPRIAANFRDSPLQ